MPLYVVQSDNTIYNQLLCDLNEALPDELTMDQKAAVLAALEETARRVLPAQFQEAFQAELRGIVNRINPNATIIDYSNLDRTTNARHFIREMVKTAIESLNPIKRNADKTYDLNENHPLYSFYSGIIIPDNTNTEDGIKPIYQKINMLDTSMGDDTEYKKMREKYPSNVNALIIGANTPQYMKDKPERLPAIFYGYGRALPNPQNNLNYEGENLTVIVNAVVGPTKELKDKNDMVTQNGVSLFDNIGKLHDSLHNAVQTMIAREVAGNQEIVDIEASLSARPLTGGLGDRELIRFEITIEWAYQTPR